MQQHKNKIFEWHEFYYLPSSGSSGISSPFSAAWFVPKNVLILRLKLSLVTGRARKPPILK